GPPDAASVGNSGVDLWGRLYAGRRRRVPSPEGVPASVGRDKPGPTKRAALALTLRTWRPACRVEIQISNRVFIRRPQLRSGTWESTCGAGFTPADGAAFPLRRVFPPLSAGINPAPQKEPHWASHSKSWRPAYRVEIQISNAVLVRRTRLRSGTWESTCGAGFTPADGAAFPVRRGFPPLSAGINPAPQKRTALGLTLRTWRPACRVGIQISNAVLGRRTRLRSGTRGVDLWGRLYAGRRRRVPTPEGVPTSVGRDKPGPTIKNRTGPRTPRAGGPLIAWKSRSATPPGIARTPPG